MLKKMQRKFIASAMAAFTIVIFILLISVNLWNYRMVTRQLDSSVDMITEKESRLPIGHNAAPPHVNAPFPEAPYMLRFFVVYCDDSGNIAEIDKDYIATVSGNEAKEYGEYVLSKGRKKGFHKSYRYIRNGSEIIFINAERELHTIKNLILISGMIAVISMSAVFILVLFFSKRAIMPYLKNIETQKRFITDAGHELKTPLTSISTSADILAMDNENDEWVQNIQKQSARMSQLISKLVALSRLDEDQPILERTEFDLSDAVWEIAESIKARAETKNKSYSQYIEDNITYCGDRNIIQQMVSILLDNAVRYSDEKGKIDLDVRRKGKKITISVSNTCRTEAIDTNRLFDRFYRPDTSRNVNSGGNGIGLSIAKSSAEVHGGKIMAKIKDNSEIVFTVIL